MNYLYLIDIIYPNFILSVFINTKTFAKQKQPCVNARMCMCPAKWITSVVSAAELPLITIHTYCTQRCLINPSRWGGAPFRCTKSTHSSYWAKYCIDHVLHIADQAVSKAFIWHHPSISRASLWQLNPDVITSTSRHIIIIRNQGDFNRGVSSRADFILNYFLSNFLSNFLANPPVPMRFWC